VRDDKSPRRTLSVHNCTANIPRLLEVGMRRRTCFTSTPRIGGVGYKIRRQLNASIRWLSPSTRRARRSLAAVYLSQSGGIHPRSRIL